MTKKEIFRILQENQNYLSSEFGLKRVGLFGSYAHGTPHDNSDIDLVVEFEKPILLRSEL